ncbi:MAG: hypothetical protein JXA61_06700 [Bacteroidales bacterium]|nr:hypothetical protein [Bacteroidales bacterium]
MKKILTSFIAVFVLVTFSNDSTCRAQVNDIGELIAAGADDAKVLLQPYLTPAVDAFGAGLGSGWYNTAKPHQLGGFDITITVNAGIVPKKFESFTIEGDEMTFLQLNDPADNNTPTIAGVAEEGPQINYNIEGFSGPAFSMPQGLNTNYIPAPMVQAGIGLVKRTELMVRYLPNIKIDENEIGLWGLGGKHDIKQWIPGLKKMPVLNISVMYGYTRLHTYLQLEVEPGDIGAELLPGAGSSDWDDQWFRLVTQSHTANLLVSANLPVVCFYGGVGFITTKTNLKLEGDFPTVYLDDVTPSVKAVADPIDMEITNREGGFTKPRLNAGIRLKLSVITLHADYSWANYSILTAGLGVSIR